MQRSEFLWFFLLVLVPLVQVPVVLLVVLVLLPAVVVQVLVLVLFRMLFEIDSFPYQLMEDLAYRLFVSYYKTSVFLFLSLQQTHHSYHTIHHVHHPADLILLPAELQYFQTEIGKNFSLLVKTFNYFFFVCNNIPEDFHPHFLIFIHHTICTAQSNLFIKNDINVCKKLIIPPLCILCACLKGL